MNVNELASTLNCEILSLPDGERLVENIYTGDLLSWVMGRAESGCAWITIMTNVNVCAVASLVDAACVIIAENAEISDEIIAIASVKGVNMLRSCASVYELCVSIHEKANL